MAYSGRDLCREHFIDLVKKRAAREVRLQGRIPQGGTVVLAVSGGKDSAAMLHIMKVLLAPRRDVRLEALLVDEGIEGYRPLTVTEARKLCDAMEVPLTIVTFADSFGATLDELWGRHLEGEGAPGDASDLQPSDEESPEDWPQTRSTDLSPCGICGVLRRRVLNDGAKRLGADVLVTGHNLDDMAQSIAMNLMSSELDRLVRLGPHPPERALPGLIPRRMPVRTIPEKETFLYAMLCGLPFDDAVCPYAVRATRGRYRDMLDGLEADVPGTRHRLLRTGDRIREMMQGSPEAGGMVACGKCGEPSSQKMCQVCQVLEKLK